MTDTQRYERWIDRVERDAEVATDQPNIDPDEATWDRDPEHDRVGHDTDRCRHEPDPVVEAHESTGVVAQCRYCNADMDARQVKLAGDENVCDECIDEETLATGVYPL